MRREIPPVKRISCWITGGLSLALMVMIFLFSAQDADASHLVSGGILNAVIGWLRPLANALIHPAPDDETLELILRKLGHFSEYAALGACLCLFLHSLDRKHCAVAAWLAATLYAGTDELHQLFSAGRTAAVTDVCIDSCGALTGIALVSLVLWLLGRRTKPD